MQSVKTDDFDSQVNADNYVYDNLGRIVEDKAKNLVQTYNKENKIITQTIGSKVITYKYDFQSKRVSKTVVNGSLTTTEYYVRDPQGNVLAIYADTLQNDRMFTLTELHIYGSSRLGTYKVDSVLWENGTTATSSNKYSFKLGQKRYELSNHLGNVQTVITDRKLVDTNTGGLITAYKADVVSVTDYYAYGMEIAERSWSVKSYRYSINGQEKSPELAPNHTTAEFWEYDARSARRWNIDPVVKPWASGYEVFSSSPVVKADFNGDTDFIGADGQKIGDDGNRTGDGRVIVVTDNSVANQIKSRQNGNPFQVSELKENQFFELPNYEIRQQLLAKYNETYNKTPLKLEGKELVGVGNKEIGAFIFVGDEYDGNAKVNDNIQFVGTWSEGVSYVPSKSEPYFKEANGEITYRLDYNTDKYSAVIKYSYHVHPNLVRYKGELMSFKQALSKDLMQSQGTFGGKEISVNHLGPSSGKSTGTKMDIENANDGQRTGIVHEMRDNSIYLYKGDKTAKLSQETFYNYQEGGSKK